MKDWYTGFNTCERDDHRDIGVTELRIRRTSELRLQVARASSPTTSRQGDERTMEYGASDHLAQERCARNRYRPRSRHDVRKLG